MSQQEYSLDQVALQLMIPRSEVRRLMDSGRLSWHLNGTGERVVARDQLEAFLAANGMPPIVDTAGLQVQAKQYLASLLANPGRIEQELARLPAEGRAQIAALFEHLRNHPDPIGAMLERICDEDGPDPHETPDA
jgi:hypothetical protein